MGSRATTTSGAIPSVRCQWALMIAAAVGKSGRLVAALRLSRKMLSYSCLALSSTGTSTGRPTGKSALETWRAILTVPLSTCRRVCDAGPPPSAAASALFSKASTTFFGPSTPSSAPTPASAPLNCGMVCSALPSICVELVDALADLADRRRRVDRLHLGVQVGDDLFRRGGDLGRLTQRCEVDASRRGIALQAERPDQRGCRRHHLGGDLLDTLGDHAHGMEVLADDRHELAHAPQHLSSWAPPRSERMPRARPRSAAAGRTGGRSPPSGSPRPRTAPASRSARTAIASL